MTKMVIRVNAALSDELASAFPHLVARHEPASTTLSGDVADAQELHGLLQLLDLLGIELVEVFTVPGG